MAHLRLWNTRAGSSAQLESHSPAPPVLPRWLDFAGRLAMLARDDLRGAKHLLYGASLAALTILAVVAYYRLVPQVEIDPDTRAYLTVAHRITTHGTWVNTSRLPGYPLLLIAASLVTGAGNLAAVSVVQACLFVVAAVEMYALAYLILRRTWAAFLVGALTGANVVLLSYVKPILSEGLALFFVVNLALAVALFLRRPRARSLWIVALWMLLVFMTRPEWIYLPVPLFAYLLFIAWRRGMARRLWRHVLGAIVALYLILGLYIAGNAVQNHFVGVTFVQNINLLGKVMQYHMQDEAPAQYAEVTRIVDSYLARNDSDPWQVTGQHALLNRNNFALAGQYSLAIIERHPVKYLIDSIPLAIESLQASAPYHPMPPIPWASGWLRYSATVLGVLVCFPVLALVWWALLVYPRTARKRQVEIMGAVALLAFYGLAITTLGGYIFYERLHTPFDPLLMLVVWGSAVAGACALYERRSALADRLRRRLPDYSTEARKPK